MVSLWKKSRAFLHQKYPWPDTGQGRAFSDRSQRRSGFHDLVDNGQVIENCLHYLLLLEREDWIRSDRRFERHLQQPFTLDCVPAHVHVAIAEHDAKRPLRMYREVEPA